MDPKAYPDIKPGKAPFKQFVNKAMLFALGRALQSLSHSDPIIQGEVRHLGEGFRLVLEIPPKGGRLSLEALGNGRLAYRGSKISADEADVAIFIKSVHSAYRMFTGQLGPDMAYAQHAMRAKGDLSHTVSVVRILETAEAYLFPSFMSRKLMKSLPPIPWGRKQLLRLKAYTLGLLFGI